MDLITEYPPQEWICPECGKEHKGPHWAHEGQIDYDKKPTEIGRVKWNRRKQDDSLDRSMEVKEGYPKTGPKVDEEGNPRALYCPHCGFEAEQIVVVRKGELPDLIDKFLLEVGVDPTKTIGDLLRSFMKFIGERKK